MALSPLLAAATKRPGPAPAAPEDKRSLARTIAGNVLSPLAAVGNVIDLPGSSVRDVLTGNNPFDQWLTPTKHENRATGREVNTHLFGTAPNDPHRWEWADVGGFATEVLTDPLLPMSGLLSGTGRALRGTGKATELFRYGVPFTKASVPVGKTLAQGLDNLASKAWQTKVPLTGGSSAVGRKFIPHSASSRADEAEKMIMVSTAKLDDAWGKGLPEMYIGPGQAGIDGRRAKFEDFLKTNKPIEASRITYNPQTGQAQFADGRHRFAVMRDAGDKQVAVMVPRSEAQAAQEALGAPSTGTTFGDVADSAKAGFNGLFDYAVKGHFKPGEQKIARSLTSAEEAAAPGATMDAFKDLEGLKPVHEQVLKEMAHIPADQHGEKWKRILQHAQDDAAGGDYAGSFERAFTEVAGVAPTPALRAAAEAPLKQLNASRMADRAAIVERGGKIGEVGGPNIGYAPHRVTKEFLESKGEDVFGGGLFADTFTRSRREVIGGIPPLHLEKMIQDSTGRYVGKTGALNIRADFGKYLGYTTKKGKAVNDITHSNKLKKWLSELDPKVKQVHEIAPEGLHRQYREGSGRIRANLDVAHKTLIDAVEPRGVAITRVYKALGMDPDASVEWVAKLTGKSLDEASKLRINKDVARSMVKVNKASQNPEWLGVLGKLADDFNKMFKGPQTLPWLPYHIRNLFSGQHLNAASEHLDPGDIATYGRNIAKSWDMMTKGDADQLFQEAIAYKAIDPHKALDDADLLGGGHSSYGAPVLNPIKSIPASWEQAGKHIADNPNGTWIGGVDKLLPNRVRQTLNTPMQWGSNMARATEFMNRMPMWLTLREKGMSAKQAAREVGKLQIDYSKISPFEKNVMRRLIPFYGFTRGIVPQVAEMLAQRPGGKLAQTIRASTAGRDDDSVMPPHIANEAAIPLGTKPDGSQSFISGFGLAPEAALPYLAAPADPKGALMNVGASLSPLLKFPMEMASGQAFFQRGPNGGRPLKELDPTIGRTVANIGEYMGLREPGGDAVNILGNRGASRVAEHLASNSPVNRLLTQARTLTDRRKTPLERANNLLSPVKITDVSPKAQERALIDASNRLADQLGAGTWQNRYFTEERLAQLDRDNPLLAAQARALQQLWNKSKVKAKGEKKGGKTKKARSSKSPERAEVNRLLRAAGM